MRSESEVGLSPRAADPGRSGVVFDCGRLLKMLSHSPTREGEEADQLSQSQLGLRFLLSQVLPAGT